METTEVKSDYLLRSAYYDRILASIAPTFKEGARALTALLHSRRYRIHQLKSREKHTKLYLSRAFSSVERVCEFSQRPRSAYFQGKYAGSHSKQLYQTVYLLSR